MQLVMLNSRAKLTISLGVATLQQEFSTNYGVISGRRGYGGSAYCGGVFDVPELFYPGYNHGSCEGLAG